MIVVVNFDALAQASDIRIERRQVVFLCWEQDLNPSRSQTLNRQQTECLLTKLLSYSGSSYQIWTRQPVPMISKHSAHFTPQSFGIRTWLWRYTCLLLLISMLWHKQAIFESKGDKLSSSAESRIRTHQGLRHQIASRMPTDKLAELSSIKLWNLNSTARPYDQRAFSPLDLTAIWHSHLALAIYMFVVVNFDALAQASDIQIERRQVVFLCWEQDSNPSGSQTPNRQQNAHWQTGWAIKDQAMKLELDSPSLWSASFQPTWPHSHLAFAPGSGDIHVCCC